MFKFSGLFAGVEEKGKFIEDFVRTFPDFQRYFVKGDNGCDEEMVDCLKFLQRKRKIDDVTSCYVARSPTEAKMNPAFDINIGRDYRGLVDILTC